MTDKQVDPYRYIDGMTRKMIKLWIAREPKRPIPWTPLAKPLGQCTVALVSSAGVALKSDRPFDQQGERDKPFWGDPSIRVLPSTTTADDVEVYHLHINPKPILQDINCALPLVRLAELQQAGEIGRVAPSHYTFQGYLPQEDEFLQQSVPEIIEGLRAEEVDVALLVPV